MENETRAAKRERWREVLELWRTSGLSKAAFCRERDIPIAQLQYWVRRLTEPSDGSFAQVRCAEDSAGLRLRLASGMEVELDRDFDPATLVRLLQAVAPRC